MASTEGLSELLDQASIHFSNARPLIPMYIHLLLSALFPIYTGAHASLSRPASAAKPDRSSKHKRDLDDEDEDEGKIQKMEGLSNKDAIVLPITAALVLTGLYFLIMKYGADLINLIMGYYFSGVGVYSVAKLINDAAKIYLSLLFPSYYVRGGSLWKVQGNERKAIQFEGDRTEAMHVPVPLPQSIALKVFPKRLGDGFWNVRRDLKQKYTVKAYIRSTFDLCMDVTIVNAVSALAGAAIILYVNTISKSWYLTNLQGFAVSYSALQLMSPTSFTTGSLILGALFCYDIWAVFFTPLMVTVAKNLDQPIKLVFPRPDEPSATPGEPPIKSFSMLGLGDIVLPGIMIGLALRFDLYMFYLKQQKKGTKVTIDSSSSEASTEEVVEKVPYVSPTGRWGDRFWTYGLPAASVPPQLRFSFRKPYFTASMIGYVVGMITTLIVMSVFQHAQPALLYLVPGVLISLWGTAVVRREVKQMWEFSEAVTGEQVDGGEDVNAGVAGKREGPASKSVKGLFERLWHEIWHGEDQKTPEPIKSQGNADGSGKGKAQEVEAASERKTKRQDDKSTIISFSVSRYRSTDSNGSNTGQPSPTKPSIVNESQNSTAASRSESSEDVIVVSSSDLEGTQVSEGPRYRTRSTKVGEKD